MALRNYGMVMFLIGCFSAFSCQAGNVSLGVEGFYDEYREPSVGVTDKAGYGSVTASYDTAFNGLLSGFIGGIDARASYGQNHYNDNADGNSGHVPQEEFEGKVKLGTYIGPFNPYIGAGVRYFIDNGKNIITNLNYAGYDRRITQAYVPAGVSFSIPSGHYFIKPTFEYDYLVYGNVNSRLQNVGPNYYNINNRQDSGSGYGLNSEIMFGSESGWEVGPFVRYWNIKDSEITTAPDGSRWIEPANTRVQVGVALRAFW